MEKYSIKSIFSDNNSKKQLKLNIKCNNCLDQRNIIKCLGCILEGCNLYKQTEIRIISFNSDIHLNETETSLINLFNKFYQSLKLNPPKRNCYQTLNICEIKSLKDFIFNEFDTHIFLKYIITKDFPVMNSNFSQKCLKCYDKQKKTFNKFQEKFRNSNLFLFFKKTYGTLNISKELIENNFSTLKLANNNHVIKKKDRNLSLLNDYIYFSKHFKAKIFQENHQITYFYQNSFEIPRKYLNKSSFIEKFLENKILNINDKEISKLGKKIDHLIQQATFLINKYFLNIPLEFRKKLALLISIDYLKIKKLFSLLVDPYIEEIFLDSAEASIYLQHQKYGRCRTNITLSMIEIDAIKTHLILESKKRIDESHPSLIYVINNEYFNSRFSLDISPYHWKNIGLDIRKMNKKTFTLFNLINLKTLNIEMACFLIFCLLFKINITIVGEVNSGKTTLLNSLDLFFPKDFRKIYIEETIETLEIPLKFNHQLKFLVDPEYKINSNKEQAIYNLLHRSGDIIILGELLNKLETNALFHCLSAGLCGLQTTHASTIKSLINRWVIHFDIDKNCLNDLGIILILKKIGQRRIIQSINEIKYSYKKKEINTIEFYKYNPKDEIWNKNSSIEDSNLFLRINDYIYFPKEKIEKLFSFLNEFFTSKIGDPDIKDNLKYNPLKEIYPKLKKIDKILGSV